MKIILSLSLLLFTALNCQAQLPRYLDGKVDIPCIRPTPLDGVIKTDTDGMDYDKKLDYKVVIDVYDEVSDSASMHGAFREAARTYNPQHCQWRTPGQIENGHRGTWRRSRCYLTNEIYNNRFGVDNPNLELLNAMKETACRFMYADRISGSSGLKKSSVADPVKVALSAKTTFIALDQQGILISM